MRAQRVRKLDAHVAEAAEANHAHFFALGHAPVMHGRVGGNAGAEQRRGSGKIEIRGNAQHKMLIDDNRVGITGFSRTDWYVTYTLTHSKHRFAAAVLADGVDFSYFQYMAFANASPQLASEFEKVYGGPPFGKTLTQWLEQSPAFLMDKIDTPLRIQTLGPESVLSDWPWYSGLSRLGKPVEMIYIPEGTHVLEKPWDRMISQQGDVEWFCFWLKGEEEPDPAKVEQYKRWHELRSRQSRAASAVGTR